MDRRGFLGGLAAFYSSVLVACSPLSALNTLSPRDSAARAGRDIAFGPLSRQKLDVYAPRPAASAAPVLVFFYGGSWNSGRRQDYAFAGRALASRGFLTIVPDYRLYPEVRYPDFLHDGAAAIRWARDHAAEYGGDPHRIVLAGHSAGAYNAAMLALDGEFVSAAGVDPSNIKAFAGLSGPYYFLPLDDPTTIATFGDYPDLPATQPSKYVTPSSPAAFLGHGSIDRLVWPSNSEGLGRKLGRAGVAEEVKVYPGLNHADMVVALSRLFRGKAPVLDDMTTFLHAHAQA
ncbi:MAG TPA: alpha/beta hydrolase [Caulobacteraceae bacterium]|nr:alpha/beta hydrolase [Caulobacteraceae bacterium]